MSWFEGVMLYNYDMQYNNNLLSQHINKHIYIYNGMPYIG